MSGADEGEAGRLVTIAAARGRVDLTYLRHRLDEEGIPYFVQGEQATGVFGGVTMTRLLVREEDADRARAMIRDEELLPDAATIHDVDTTTGEVQRGGSKSFAWWVMVLLFGLFVLVQIINALR